jgi:pyridoxine/pyridoxamine 5'-phosphate oxidase
VSEDLRERWRAEQQRAVAASDPMAPLVSLATVARTGQPEVRTLVLRWLNDQPALFVNATSPKWEAITAEPRVALLAYWPSLKIQYRLDGTVTPLAAEPVQRSWRMRPPVPRKLDQLYESKAAQSSVLPPSEDLASWLAATDEDPQAVPASATGLLFAAERIERLALQDNAPHDRAQARAAHQWQLERLMP